MSNHSGYTDIRRAYYQMLLNQGLGIYEPTKEEVLEYKQLEKDMFLNGKMRSLSRIARELVDMQEKRKSDKIGFDLKHMHTYASNLSDLTNSLFDEQEVNLPNIKGIFNLAQEIILEYYKRNMRKNEKVMEFFHPYGQSHALFKQKHKPKMEDEERTILLSQMITTMFHDLPEFYNKGRTEKRPAGAILKWAYDQINEKVKGLTEDEHRILLSGLSGAAALTQDEAQPWGEYIIESVLKFSIEPDFKEFIPEKEEENFIEVGQRIVLAPEKIDKIYNVLDRDDLNDESSKIDITFRLKQTGKFLHYENLFRATQPKIEGNEAIFLKYLGKAGLYFVQQSCLDILNHLQQNSNVGDDFVKGTIDTIIETEKEHQQYLFTRKRLPSLEEVEKDPKKRFARAAMNIQQLIDGKRKAEIKEEFKDPTTQFDAALGFYRMAQLFSIHPDLHITKQA